MLLKTDPTPPPNRHRKQQLMRLKPRRAHNRVRPHEPPTTRPHPMLLDSLDRIIRHELHIFPPQTRQVIRVQDLPLAPDLMPRQQVLPVPLRRHLAHVRLVGRLQVRADGRAARHVEAGKVALHVRVDLGAVGAHGQGHVAHARFEESRIRRVLALGEEVGLARELGQAFDGVGRGSGGSGSCFVGSPPGHDGHELRGGAAVADDDDVLARPVEVVVPLRRVEERAAELFVARDVAGVGHGEGADGGDQGAGAKRVGLAGRVVLDGDVPGRCGFLPLCRLDGGAEADVWLDLVLVGDGAEVGLDLGLHRVFARPVGVQSEAV